MITLLHIVLILAFVIPAVYYFIFAVAGRMYRRPEISSPQTSRFCILIPAYSSDGFIHATVQSALNQDYPKDKFRVIVISDHMKTETDEAIRRTGAEKPAKGSRRRITQFSCEGRM